MNKYEAMIIIKPVDEEQNDAVIAKFDTLLKNQGATVEKIDRWGKRRLAYEINDINDGYYVLFHFTCAPGVIAELDRVLKITDEVLRHLVVKH